MRKHLYQTWKSRDMRNQNREIQQVKEDICRLEAENKKLQEINILLEDELKQQNLQYDKKMAEYEKKISDLKLQCGKTIQSKKDEKLIILSLGKEIEFFDGEAKELIIDALKEYIRNIEPERRRTHIINSIIEANQDNSLQKKKQTIKQVLKDFSGMTSVIKRELNKLGFDISANEKVNRHFKITYYGDSRYHATTSVTSSDCRAGQNLASILNKIAF